jgi:hypothetical protein
MLLVPSIRMNNAQVIPQNVDFSKPIRTTAGLTARYLGHVKRMTFPHCVAVEGLHREGFEGVVFCDSQGLTVMNGLAIENAPRTQELWITLHKYGSGQIDWISTTRKPERQANTLAQVKVVIEEGRFD